MQSKNVKLASSIIAAIDQTNHQLRVNEEIFSEMGSIAENEFLLILKPELFTQTLRPQLENIIHFILEKLDAFELQVSNARVINANYLNEYNLIAQHYGIINLAASNFKSMITAAVASNFIQHYGKDLIKAPVFGALELLRKGTLDADTLNTLWNNCEIKRLAGGIYSGKTNFKGKELYIVNGFHPPQLEHFIADKRLIITMNITGNTKWKVARNELIGNTYPEKANAGSIRGELYSKYGNFGFDHVSYVVNGVHLSAGPLEGLIELQRFNTMEGNKAGIDNFIFGKMLLEHLDAKQVETILSNPMVNIGGSSMSLFDLTEEKDSKEAVRLLVQISDQFKARSKD